MARKVSREYTLYGDLDGMTVSQIREMLDEYPEDAVLDVSTEYYGDMSGDCMCGRGEDQFVFIWEEANANRL